MKNIFFILILLSFYASGQRMGLKAGVNIGKEKISESGISITSESSILYMAGFFISDQLSDEISIGTELIYSVDGGKFNLSNYGLSGNYTQRFHYISLPFLAKYHASRYFNVNAGPQVGFLLKAEEDNGVDNIDFTSDVKPVNFSVVFGAEANFNTIDIGFRYVLGVSDINDTDDSSFKVNLTTIQVYLCQTF